MPKRKGPPRCKTCKGFLSNTGGTSFCKKCLKDASSQVGVEVPEIAQLEEISDEEIIVIPGPSSTERQKCKRCNQYGHNSKTCRRKKQRIEADITTENDASQVAAELIEAASESESQHAASESESQHAANEGVNEPIHNEDIQTDDMDNTLMNEEDDEECLHCHRRSTYLYTVTFTSAHYEISRRQYGDRNLQQNQKVCSECSIYTDKAFTYQKWGNAWPAFFYSMLTDERYNTLELSSHIVGLLPSTIRSTYEYIVLKKGTTNVVRSWTSEPLFSDLTNTIDRFEKEVCTSFGKLKKWINRTAFPTIRCPLGCYLYIGNKSSYELIPLNHYIVTKYDAHLFEARKLLCRGFRPDFPCSITEFEEFIVQPAIIIDRNKGPCILSCNSDVHSPPSKDFIHIPSNPVWSGYGQYMPVDVLAPVTVNPNFIKSGANGTYNTSFPVLRLKGTAGGVSSFTLNPMRTEFYSPNEKEDMAAGLALTHRPDIFKACSNVELLPKEFAESNRERFANASINPSIIEKAKTSGTFVPIHDCLHLIKLAKQDSQKTPEDATLKIKKISVGVHPHNHYGMKPVVAPFFTFANVFDQKIVLYINSLINIVGNCLPIYSILMKSPEQCAASATLDLFNLINRIHTTTQKCHVIARKSLIDLGKRLLLSTYDNIDEAINNYSTEILTLTTLKTFLTVNTSFVDYDGIFTIEELLESISDVVVVNCLVEVDDIPQSSGGRYLILSLQCTPERNTIVFRWLMQNSYYHLSTNSPVKKLNNFPQSSSPQILIYATENSLRCLNEDEFLEIGGTQNKAKCGVHNVNLVRRHRGTQDLCSNCNRKRAFICSSIMTNIISQPCNTGLCIKHEKEVQAGNMLKEIFPKPLRQNENPIVNDDSEDDDDNDMREEVIAFEFEDIAPDAENELPDIMFNKTKNRPLYRVDTTSATSGHFLTNNYLGCFNRPFLNRKCPISFQQTLSTWHAVSGQHTYPLIQPEGYLFPTIFWISANDGSTVGALPSAMFSDHVSSYLPKGIANLDDHMQVRIRDGSLATSKNPQYLSFVFDVTLNRTLQSNPVALCFNRGLEHLNRGSTSFDKTSRLQFDEIDSNRNARNLSGMLRKDNWSYFVTITSCDSKTMGLAPIRAAIDKSYCHDPELHSNVLQNCALLFVRGWNRVLKYFFKTLENDETVFGKVKRYFARVEFQSAGAKGNRSHVHAGLTVEPNSMTKQQLQEKIENVLSNAFSDTHQTDLESLHRQGIVSSKEHYDDLVQFYQQCQIHTCSSRCRKRMADESMKCRARKHPPSFEHSYEEFHDCYHHVVDIMEDIGLAEFNENTNEMDVIKELRPGIYHPATEMYSRAVPTIPKLTFITESQTNVQVCDSRSGASYTAKYATKIEERRQVIVTKEDKKTVHVEALPLYNAGIPSAKSAEETLRKKLNKNNPLMREISFAETLHFVTGDPFVYHNMEFVQINTNMLEYRCSTKTFTSGEANKKLINENNELIPILSRKNFPRQRQFLNDQQILIRDLSTSPYSLDNTTAFSLRPPELLHVKKLEYYSTWFHRKSATKYVASLNLPDSPWIDGGCFQVLIRIYHLDDVLSFYSNIRERGNCDATVLQMVQLIEDLVNERNNFVDGTKASDRFQRFVDITKTKETIAVFSTITPAKMDKFIYHLILSLGEFNTELDFFGLSCKETLAKAGLLTGPPDDPMESVRSLCKRYILEQLRFLGIGSGEFSRLVKLLYEGLQSIIVYDSIEYGTTPLLTQRAIQEEALEKLQKFESDNRESLLKALEFDSPQDVTMLNSPNFEITITAAPGQTPESLHEQKKAFAFIINTILNYCNPTVVYQKSVFISGPPGAGKTFIFQKALLYCMSKQLRVVVTALTSERARKLGGEHVHFLFCIPVQQSNNETCAGSAAKTISQLIKNPVRMAFLKRVDVIGVEEIGLIPSNILAVMDTVLRSIRQVDQPFGGVLIIASGDNEQLRPVCGNSVFRSSSFPLYFNVLQLSHMVRARADEQLQTVITLIRKHKLTRNDKQKVLNIIKTRCSANFLADFADVPLGVVSIVGLRKAEEQTNNTIIEKMLQEGNHSVYISDAEDTVSSGLGHWTAADTTASRKIDRQSLEPKRLYIFHNSVYKLTYNNTTQHLTRFSQGQQCVVTQIPGEVNDFTVTVRLMPPGCRELPSANIPQSWPEVKLKKRPNAACIVSPRMTKGRRLQYPLRPNICSTVHKCIGDSVPALSTMISKNNSIYRLWDKQQLLVIVSRVPTLSNIYFVGQLQDTLNAIKELLDQTDIMLKLQADVIDNLDVFKNTARIVPPLQQLHWQFEDCSIPSVDMGFVYMVVNSKNLNEFKLGECVNIKKEMEQINAPSLKKNHGPFILLLHIHNFVGDPHEDSNSGPRQDVLTMLKGTPEDYNCNLQQQIKTVKELHQDLSLSDDELYNNLTLTLCYKM